MNVNYSNHAIEEMDKRDISKDIIDSIMQNPEQVIEQGNFEIFQSKTEINNRIFVIRVITKKQENSIKIITVYKTTKIKKYWREQ